MPSFFSHSHKTLTSPSLFVLPLTYLHPNCALSNIARKSRCTTRRGQLRKTTLRTVFSTRDFSPIGSLEAALCRTFARSPCRVLLETAAKPTSPSTKDEHPSQGPSSHQQKVRFTLEVSTAIFESPFPRCARRLRRPAVVSKHAQAFCH